MPHPLRPHDPRSIGRYELDARLGQGGMGVVYRGRDNGRPVAVKVLRDELAFDDEFRGRFRSEVSRIRQVPPFCTAEVLDADLDHVPPYLVVEYVDGPSLAEVVRGRGPLRDAQLHSVALGMATALVAIHGAGVVHRDLKPENVLLGLVGVKVIDFGIARALEMTSHHTSTGQMIGTVAYMAPERLDGDAARATGPAGDIFAWGAVVAYAATGRSPFGGDSPTATAVRILTQPPDVTGIPGPLREVVRRALEKNPDDRPTAKELLDLLLPGEAGNEVIARPAVTATPRRRRARGLAVVAAAAAVLGVLTVVGAVGTPRLLDRQAGTSAGATPGASPAPSSAPPPSSAPAPPVVEAASEPFSFTVRGWADGRLRVSDPLTVSTAYQMSVIRARSNAIVGTLVLYRPGAFAAGKLKNVNETTVDGRRALVDESVPATNASAVRTRFLAWEYADDAWATMRTYPTEDEPSIKDLRSLAAKLDTGTASPAKLPFVMSYVPEGYRPVEVGVHAWAGENGLVTADDGNYAGAIFANPGPDPTGLTEPWSPDESDAVSDNFVMLVSPNTGRRTEGIVCTGDDFCRRYDGKAFVELISYGRLSDEEMTRILEGVELAAVADDSTWTDTLEALPVGP